MNMSTNVKAVVIYCNPSIVSNTSQSYTSIQFDNFWQMWKGLDVVRLNHARSLVQHFLWCSSLFPLTLSYLLFPSLSLPNSLPSALSLSPWCESSGVKFMGMQRNSSISYCKTGRCLECALPTSGQRAMYGHFGWKRERERNVLRTMFIVPYALISLSLFYVSSLVMMMVRVS